MKKILNNTVPENFQQYCYITTKKTIKKWKSFELQIKFGLIVF